MTNEKELIRRAQAGDQKAFELLIKRHKDRIYSIASAICSKLPSEAEDVAQETLISAMKNINTFKGNSTFATWLYKIATNNCWQKFRKLNLQNFEEIPDEKNKNHPSRHCVIENALKNELSNAVYKALDILPLNYKMAVVLIDIEGLSYKDAAEKMKISIPALKTRLHRARKILKENLKDFH